jgi:quercetin dioxygenase-like cupin family protein
MTMPVFAWSELEQKMLFPDHCAATGAVYRGERIAVVRVHYPAGSEVKPHATRREQVHSIIAGAATYRVGGDERRVGPGDAVLIRANTEHAVTVHEAMEVIGFQDAGPIEEAPPPGPPGPAFFTWGQLASDFITPRYSSGQGPTITGDRLEVALMCYPAGTEGKPHAHPNEQIQVALRGKSVGMIAGKEETVEPGQGVLFPANVEHGGKMLEDYTVLNGKNVVPGWSTYHARWER